MLRQAQHERVGEISLLIHRAELRTCYLRGAILAAPRIAVEGRDMRQRILNRPVEGPILSREFLEQKLRRAFHRELSAPVSMHGSASLFGFRP